MARFYQKAKNCSKKFGGRIPAEKILPAEESEIFFPRNLYAKNFLNAEIWQRNFLSVQKIFAGQKGREVKARERKRKFF
jgi:hypothetical protein